MQLIIKVCGMREPENIIELQELGVDWVGMIFFEKSTRHVTAPITLKKQVPRVGVFVNERIAVILNKAQAYNLDFVQLHGDESVDLCQKVKEQGLRVIKVFSVGNTFDFMQLSAYAASVDYFLFDTKGQKRGGNGVAFDWDILKEYDSEVPFLLSGGIDIHSVAAIKAFQHPRMVGVDINSRFETVPGLKDINKIKAFIDELRCK